MNYEQFADELVGLVGGKDNVIELVHCVTRLRFTLVDVTKAQTEEIKKLKGVLSVIDTGKQYQVVVGGEVIPSYNAIIKKYSFNENGVVKTTGPKGKVTVQGIFAEILDFFSGTMVQIIPLFIGCGLINCILSVGKICFGLDSSTATYAVLNSIANAPFYFLPILVGYASAKKLKCNVMLGSLLGMVLLHPSFTGLIGGEVATTFMGIPFEALNYSSSLFPVLLGVLVLSKVEPFVYKILPKILKTVFGPLLCIAIMVPLMIFVLGPIGYYTGQGIANIVLALMNLPFGLGCALMSALQPVLVLFGAHTVLAAPMIEAINTVGYDTLVRPAFIMASMGSFGAVLAVALKCKNQELKGLALSCSVTQFLGTAEPTYYGVLLPLGKPFFTALVGAACGGLVSSLLGAKAYAMGKNGVFGWLVFEDTIIWIILASVVAIAVGFILTWIVGFDENKIANK